MTTERQLEITVDWIRRLPDQCVLLNPEKGLRRFNGCRMSWENGRKILVNYRDMKDDKDPHLMTMGESNEVEIHDFAEWCQPEVRMIGGDQRSCIAPF